MRVTVRAITDVRLYMCIHTYTSETQWYASNSQCRVHTHDMLLISSIRNAGGSSPRGFSRLRSYSLGRVLRILRLAFPFVPYKRFHCIRCIALYYIFIFHFIFTLYSATRFCTDYQSYVCTVSLRLYLALGSNVAPFEGYEPKPAVRAGGRMFHR